MGFVTLAERLPAPPPGTGDELLQHLLVVEAASRGGPLASLDWEAPRPWSAPGQERVVGRGPALEVVVVRGVDGPTAIRVARSAAPAFQLTWKRGAELALSATVDEAHVPAVRAALGGGLPAAKPAPAPVPLARSALLVAVAEAATGIGDELSALDHGAGSHERIAALERKVRAAYEELPGDDVEALRAAAPRELVACWSELAAAARARAVAPPQPERLRQLGLALRANGASTARQWAVAATRLREALAVAPPAQPKRLAEAWLEVVHCEAAAGELAGARGAFSQALEANAAAARRALWGAPLEAWRGELAALGHRGKLPAKLKPYEDALAATWAAVVPLEAVAGNVDDGPTSRLGGLPSLPEDTPWPSGADGAPMQFLLQVALASLPTLPPLPRSGLLLFFVAKGAAGAGFAAREAGVRVVHVSAPPAVARAAPAGTSPLVPKACALSGTAHAEPACPPDVRLARACPALAADGAALRALSKAFPTTGSRLGGAAFFNQEDPRAKDPARADHVQLLQIAEEPAAGLAWGDAGVGHVFVPRDDLARLSFTSAWWWWDSV